MPRIELIGGVGVGKSTLATTFGTFKGFTPVYENLKDNPFLDGCYKDPKTFRFPSQMYFALQKYKTIGEHLSNSQVFVHDQGTLNNNAYTNMLFKDPIEGLQDATQWMIIKSTFEETERVLGKPELLIHLKCDPEEELRRIHSRGRSFELGITKEFLQKFNAEITSLLDQERLKGYYKIVEFDVTHMPPSDYTVIVDTVVSLKFI